MTAQEKFQIEFKDAIEQNTSIKCFLDGINEEIADQCGLCSCMSNFDYIPLLEKIFTYLKDSTNVSKSMENLSIYLNIELSATALIIGLLDNTKLITHGSSLNCPFMGDTEYFMFLINKRNELIERYRDEN